MIMREAVALAVFLSVAGCSQAVTIPTEAQFEQNPDLLKTWISKCQHGEYSNVGAEEKQRMCGSAQVAANIETQRQAARAADNSFGNAILRR
ncbi:MAG: hypothetical protein EOO77_26035 [Oxalobacteraceae bacterium]|nr:MAG: hypothetical protein EOO77_26035 [Oxalobacteraceae bacterium]